MAKTFGQLNTSSLIKQPRLSEKAIALNKLDQYVFTVNPKATKLEVKKQLELLYGISIKSINMVSMAGKSRRYGRTSGTTKAFKKAIVTLTKTSKKPEIIDVV
jgi:large subunit ribosomal protein L23